MGRGSSGSSRPSGPYFTKPRITIKSVGREFKLAGRFKRLADKAGVKVNWGDLGNSGVLGVYAPGTNSVIISSKNTEPSMVKATLLHEIGHGKDYNIKGIRTKYNSTVSGNKKEHEQIWVNRYNRYVAKADRVKTWAEAQKHMSAGFKSYFTSTSETIADAHSQFVLGASSLKKSAPGFHKLFNDTKKLRK